MMMKKFSVLTVLIGIGIMTAAAQTPGDGFYFAQDSDYANNQKNQVVLEVRGGKIASANWNILSLNAGARDLKTIARSGSVPAAANWAAQAAATEQFLVTNQDTNAASVPGGPGNVGPFFTLVRRALGGNAVAKGAYTRDGWYYAEAAAADSYHTKNSVLITVVNGSIVDVLWNGILQGMPASINPSKIITSRANGYPMTGARSLWHVQAAAASAALVQAQDPARIPVKADQKTDAVSGVSIQVKDYLDVAAQALRAAR
jgi:major membrane immunogen (membrane-anchored lipoprotein)